MNLTYTMQGDYLLPNLEVPESPRVGKYGMLRRSFLRSHRKALYTGMMLSDRLNPHLEEVDKLALFNQFISVCSKCFRVQFCTNRVEAFNFIGCNSSINCHQVVKRLDSSSFLKKNHN